jgi:hypothetical protein
VVAVWRHVIEDVAFDDDLAVVGTGRASGDRPTSGERADPVVLGRVTPLPSLEVYPTARAVGDRRSPMLRGLTWDRAASLDRDGQPVAWLFRCRVRGEYLGYRDFL